nr:hypothetical protein [Abalone asfa-like virus]
MSSQDTKYKFVVNVINPFKDDPTLCSYFEGLTLDLGVLAYGDAARDRKIDNWKYTQAELKSTCGLHATLANGKQSNIHLKYQVVVMNSKIAVFSKLNLEINARPTSLNEASEICNLLSPKLMPGYKLELGELKVIRVA